MIFAHDTAQAAFDLDGILCEDPTGGIFDPANARPLYVPTHPIQLVITGRSDSYRDLTLDWFAKHELVVYRLVMRPTDEYPGFEQMARWKAEAYRLSGLPLYVESNIDLAHEIARMACRPVLCPSVESIIEPPVPVLGMGDAIGRRIRTCPKRLELCCGAARCVKKDHVIVYRHDCHVCPDLPIVD
jgi:hypothetical protein